QEGAGAAPVSAVQASLDSHSQGERCLLSCEMHRIPRTNHERTRNGTLRDIVHVNNEVLVNGSHRRRRYRRRWSVMKSATSTWKTRYLACNASGVLRFMQCLFFVFVLLVICMMALNLI